MGKEPTSITETVEVIPEQHPSAGPSLNVNSIVPSSQEMEAPIYVWDVSFSLVDDGEVGAISGEPVATLQYSTTDGDLTIFSETQLESADDLESYSGYYMTNGLAQVWLAYYTEGQENTSYVYTTDTIREETVTTVTKHPVAQKYLPNADWNVSDPESDGYIENRTHFIDIDVGVLEFTEDLGYAVGTKGPAKPIGFTIDVPEEHLLSEYYPSFEASYFEVSAGGDYFTGYLLAEDEFGNQIVDPLDSSNITKAILCIDYTEFVGSPAAIWDIMDVANNINLEVSSEIVPYLTVLGETSVYRKLDSRFIDWKNAPYPSENWINPTLDYNEPNNNEDNLGKNVGYIATEEVALHINYTKVGYNYVLTDFTPSNDDTYHKSEKVIAEKITKLLPPTNSNLYNESAIKGFFNAIYPSTKVVITYDSVDYTYNVYDKNINNNFITFSDENYSQFSIVWANSSGADRDVCIRMSVDDETKVTDIKLYLNYNPPSLLKETAVDIHDDVDSIIEEMSVDIQTTNNTVDDKIKIVEIMTGFRLFGIRDPNATRIGTLTVDQDVEYFGQYCAIDQNLGAFTSNNWQDKGEYYHYNRYSQNARDRGNVLKFFEWKNERNITAHGMGTGILRYYVPATETTPREDYEVPVTVDFDYGATLYGTEEDPYGSTGYELNVYVDKRYIKEGATNLLFGWRLFVPHYV